jgi:integrase
MRHGRGETHRGQRLQPAPRHYPFPRVDRERFLTSSELDRLGAALRKGETTGLPWQVDPRKVHAKHAPKEDKRLTKISPHAAAAIRLLLFTGCRLGKILRLRWLDVDLERGLLFLTDSKTGRKTVVLNAPAAAILAELPRLGIYVIAGNECRKECGSCITSSWWQAESRSVSLAYCATLHSAGRYL